MSFMESRSFSRQLLCHNFKFFRQPTVRLALAQGFDGSNSVASATRSSEANRLSKSTKVLLSPQQSNAGIAANNEVTLLTKRSSPQSAIFSGSSAECIASATDATIASSLSLSSLFHRFKLLSKIIRNNAGPETNPGRTLILCVIPSSSRVEC